MRHLLFYLLLCMRLCAQFSSPALLREILYDRQRKDVPQQAQQQEQGQDTLAQGLLLPPSQAPAAQGSTSCMSPSCATWTPRASALFLASLPTNGELALHQSGRLHLCFVQPANVACCSKVTHAPNKCRLTFISHLIIFWSQGIAFIHDSRPYPTCWLGIFSTLLCDVWFEWASGSPV